MSNNVELKFCKDCKHCRPSKNWFFSKKQKFEFARCAVFKKQHNADFLIHGIIDESLYYCGTVRSITGSCGPAGKAFEPK